MIKTVRAISLFSGGLDSICATRVVMSQGIEVIGLKFVTPFFGYDILDDPEKYYKKTRDKYGIDVRIVDISDDYLKLLRDPPNGFGKYFNPCIDCKIFMLERAVTMMDDLDASFLITGEVLGQRPMSQRRDTLNVIERDSKTRGRLLRPLSARLMAETDAEKEGLVDRDRLLDFSGRGRSPQIALAKSMGITDFPAPAGGCILADPILSKRIAMLYSDDFVVDRDQMNVTDILLTMVGRQYLLPGGGWMILGRDEKENLKLDRLREACDIRLDMEERAGPTALIRRAEGTYGSRETRECDIAHAAGLITRYSKKTDGEPQPGNVMVEDGSCVYEVYAPPVLDDVFKSWTI